MAKVVTCEEFRHAQYPIFLHAQILVSEGDSFFTLRDFSVERDRKSQSTVVNAEEKNLSERDKKTGTEQ